jgi:hypothetical protein
MFLHLNQFSVLAYAVLIAFAVVYVIKPSDWFKRKPPNRKLKRNPFNCLPCMTGWLALIIALCSGHTYEAILLMAAGIGLGGITEGIIMRYL